MQINTNTEITHYAMATYTLANHIFGITKALKIPYEYNEIDNAVTVDLSERIDEMKAIINDIEPVLIANSNFNNPPEYYINHIIELKNRIYDALGSTKMLYIELNFTDVYTFSKNIQTA